MIDIAAMQFLDGLKDVEKKKILIEMELEERAS